MRLSLHAAWLSFKCAQPPAAPSQSRSALAGANGIEQPASLARPRPSANGTDTARYLLRSSRPRASTVLQPGSALEPHNSASSLYVGTAPRARALGPQRLSTTFNRTGTTGRCSMTRRIFSRCANNATTSRLLARTQRSARRVTRLHRPPIGPPLVPVMMTGTLYMPTGGYFPQRACSLQTACQGQIFAAAKLSILLFLGGPRRNWEIHSAHLLRN